MNHNEISEKPILMSAPMVKAILANLKTQTRRTTGLKKINEDPDRYLFHRIEGGVAIFYDGKKGESFSVKLPYGLPGGFLWVREKHQAVHYSYDCESGQVDDIEQADKFPKEAGPFYDVIYAADYYKNVTNPKFIGGACDTVEDRGFAWRPSIFMHRWASRINLEIIKIKVERLNDISEKDASAEGCNLEWYRDNAGTGNLWPCPQCQGFQVHGCPGENMGMSECDCVECDTSKKMFVHLWESINGPGSWAANPWLFVVEFERVKS